MTDSDSDALRRWLADDLLVLNTVFLVAATALALALTFCLWHHIRPGPSLDQQHTGHAPSIFSTVLSPLHISAARAVPSTNHQQSLAVLAPEQKDRKSTRSKERRRRGKDPFRDLWKGGKKSDALLKSVNVAGHDSLFPSANTLSSSTALADDTASSTSRSQSPDPAGDLVHRTLRLDVESDDRDVGNTVSSGNTSSASTVISSNDSSDRGSSDACSRTDAVRPHSVPPDSMTSVDTQVSSVSTDMGHASEDAPSSPSVSTACAVVCTPQPRNSQAASVSENCTKLVRARTRLRLSRIETSTKSPLSSPAPPALPDSVATPSPSIHSSVPCPPLSIFPSASRSTDGAGPSTPTNSRGSTPPPQSRSPPEDSSQGETQPSGQSAASAQIELASMHGALEAARLREEQLRVAAEQANNERDELRWRWSEDVGLWRRREAELQAQIYHLMQQLQAYAVASFQAQQLSSSGFSSPTSPHAHSSPLLRQHPPMSFPFPPVIQTQNSASAPAHVQALLAAAPMLTSHSPGFAAPTPAGFYSGTDLGRSPLLRSGLGLCVPKQDSRHGGRWTPDSSASGSSRSRRGRGRGHAENKSASDESSLGEWDGTEDGSGDEDLWEEEDVFRNNALADAILKRPESIRGLSGSAGKRSRMGRGRPLVYGTGEVGRGGAEERMDALKDPALEKHRFVPPLIDTPAVKTVADAVDQQ